LREFLEYCGCTGSLSLSGINWEDAEIVFEEQARRDRNIFDVYVSVDKKFQIIIECKLDSQLDVNQLKRYADWGAQQSNYFPEFVVISLTRNEQDKKSVKPRHSIKLRTGILVNW